MGNTIFNPIRDSSPFLYIQRQKALNDHPAINENCLYKGKSACSKSHLFVLGKVTYNYKHAVTQLLE
ncbi:hypothetical protein D1839_06900 [Roseburia sp. 1XD42-34]|nr:hypothetical protein [Roseburia sp. 1XD42-34]RKI79175.1 hypothetical protein D7V87_06890 [Clostridium sp. 1xD42-85]